MLWAIDQTHISFYRGSVGETMVSTIIIIVSVPVVCPGVHITSNLSLPNCRGEQPLMPHSVRHGEDIGSP